MVSLFVRVRWVSAFLRNLRGEQGVDMYPFATSARTRHPPTMAWLLMALCTCADPRPGKHSWFSYGRLRLRSGWRLEDKA
jgi:hypothetical protein